MKFSRNGPSKLFLSFNCKFSLIPKLLIITLINSVLRTFATFNLSASVVARLDLRLRKLPEIIIRNGFLFKKNLFYETQRKYLLTVLNVCTMSA